MLPVLRVDLGPGVEAFFTTRGGGVSSPPFAGLNLGAGVSDAPDDVSANRRLVREHLAARGARSLTWSRPVHGADVREVSSRVSRDPSVDALLTREPGHALAVLAADCVPVLLAARREGDLIGVGAVHAGRRGVVAGAVIAVVDRLRDVGGEDLCAVIGPAICPRCYEVGAEVQAEVCATVPQARAVSLWGTPSLDLPGAIASQLEGAGVAVNQVAMCTRTDESLFSYRRDGVTGRCAGVVATRRAWLPHEGPGLV